MKQTDASGSPDLEALRSILLGEERRELDALRQQLDANQSDTAQHDAKLAALTELAESLQARADDQAAFVEATAEALPAALQHATEHDQAAVSRAISPVVVTSIKREIANSRDDMVDALYPITGRLVTAAVRNAIANLSEDINERMNALTSGAIWKARAQAWRTGQPVSTIMLAQSGGFKMVRAMLLDRGAGTPLSVAEAEDVPERSDTELISGMLAALSNLAEEVYNSAEDELRRLDLNGRQIALRRSASQLLIVEFVGRLPADVQAEIDRRFVDIVSHDESDQAALDTSVSALLGLEPSSEQEASKPSSKYLQIACVGLLVLALGWYIGSAIGRWQVDRVAAKITAVLEADPQFRALPLRVVPRYDDGSVELRGLVPGSLSIPQFQATVANRSGVSGVRYALTPFADLGSLRNTEAVAVSAEREVGRLNTVVEDLGAQVVNAARDEDVSTLQSQIDLLDNVFDSNTASLHRAANEADVRFEDGLTLARDDDTRLALQNLAELLKQTPRTVALVPLIGDAADAQTAWGLARARHIRAQMLGFGAHPDQVNVLDPVVVEDDRAVDAVRILVQNVAQPE